MVNGKLVQNAEAVSMATLAVSGDALEARVLMRSGAWVGCKRSHISWAPLAVMAVMIMSACSVVMGEWALRAATNDGDEMAKIKAGDGSVRIISTRARVNWWNERYWGRWVGKVRRWMDALMMRVGRDMP